MAYHRPSGRTHLLNDVSHLLLTDYLQEARSTRDVVDHLVARGAVEDDELHADILAMLGRFEQLGLIDRS